MSSNDAVVCMYIITGKKKSTQYEEMIEIERIIDVIRCHESFVDCRMLDFFPRVDRSKDVVECAATVSFVIST